MTSDEARGLTSQQAWTLEHIERCYACGAWTVVTKHGGYKPAICQHLTPKSATKGQAA